MPNNANQKLRLLRLLEIFIRKTDATEGLTTNQLLDALAEHGIFAERKALYRDFKAMRSFGLEIAQNKAHQWYLANRPFSFEELVLLVDCVQSTPFLTDKMSRGLISKLKGFSSESQETSLNRRIKIPNYVKMQNEGVFKNLDAIQRAIQLRKKVEFKYFLYDLKKEKVFRKKGQSYIVIPLELVFANESYYLLTLNEEHGGMAPFRVDRMANVTMLEEQMPKRKQVASWKLEDDVVLSFGVFSASVVPVVLEVEEDRINVLIDKFGYEIDMGAAEKGWARAYVRVPLSPQFFGWLLQLGSHIRIVSPSKAIDEYRCYLSEALSMYES